MLMKGPLKGKIVSLSEAISEIKDGDFVCLDGFTVNRRPMAAVYEMIRQGKKDLHGFIETSIAEEIAIAGGCFRTYEGCYNALELFGVAPRGRRAIERGELIHDDVGHLWASLRLMAGALGAPCIATRCGLGTDVVNPEYDLLKKIRELRSNDPAMPAKKFEIIDDPFFGEGPMILLPPARPKFTIAHVQQVGDEGMTLRVYGSHQFTPWTIMAAEKVIITCEEIVAEEFLRQTPEMNLFVPPEHITMVVEVPFGAHPTQLTRYYDMDFSFIRDYLKAAQDNATLKNWLDEWVVDVKDHWGYLQKLGVKKLESLRVRPPFTYRPVKDLLEGAS